VQQKHLFWIYEKQNWSFLSACETGKGEEKNSEGVYGLRKAFSDAGAQNIIMSLWKVDDKVTQEFMSRFYEIWLNEKTTIREAFHRTQLEIKARYPQPYYWGAFILVGE
jgi:CHAT domain-containing protein